ncbi:MAG TPA: protein phosphatase 2C domain-containing protein [Vicinamibacterales bacterium]|nr:protein phosphatase 2C domain-containing protein [Vicinamibacterales bacterium]
MTAHARTHTGPRATNEDSVLWDPELALLAVADGMGGHNAGEVASRVALDQAQEFLRLSVTADDFTWPFGLNAALSMTANRLLTAVKLANREIFRSAQEHAEYNGMGTTVVMAIIEGAHLTFASVGDSRLYSLTGSHLRQLTRDDSWVMMLSEETGVDADALRGHPMHNVLTSVVGARMELEVAVHELDLEDGQTLMICSDGLHGVVPDEVIRQTLQEEPDLARAADRLIETALARQGRDNVTVLLARYNA